MRETTPYPYVRQSPIEQGGPMNRTTIYCPRCHHDDNDLLGLPRDEATGFVVGHRVHCRSCENVWVDLRAQS